jgi:hypothetical protein
MSRPVWSRSATALGAVPLRLSSRDPVSSESDPFAVCSPQRSSACSVAAGPDFRWLGPFCACSAALVGSLGGNAAVNQGEALAVWSAASARWVPFTRRVIGNVSREEMMAREGYRKKFLEALPLRPVSGYREDHVVAASVRCRVWDPALGSAAGFGAAGSDAAGSDAEHGGRRAGDAR